MDMYCCSEEDARYVGAFYNQTVLTLIERKLNYPKWVLGGYPSEDSAVEAISRQAQYMCVDDDWIVGAFVLDDDPEQTYLQASWPLDLKQGEYLVIHALAVNPDLWGKGIGTEMVAWCAEEAMRRGCKALRTDTAPDNAPADALYLSCGFEKVGESDLGRDIEGLSTFSLFELAL
ncbi:MAG: GNAT family N-acetyltransferase [Atopobiaceae bacterium]|nr:GNAT family N-acetyltransferase [Atopobiaceae bacterium]